MNNGPLTGEIINNDTITDDVCELADDNPLYIIDKLKDKNITVKDLTRPQRRQTVMHLLGKGFIQAEIGRIMDMSRSLVSDDVKYMERKLVEQLLGANSIEFVGRLAQQAEMVKGMAHEKKDYSFIWKVDTDLFDRLQKVGLIPEAPKKVDLSGLGSTKKELIECILGTVAGVDADDAAVQADETD